MELFAWVAQRHIWLWGLSFSVPMGYINVLQSDPTAHGRVRSRAYCITFLPKSDGHRQLHDVHGPGRLQAKASRSCPSGAQPMVASAAEKRLRLLQRPKPMSPFLPEREQQSTPLHLDPRHVHIKWGNMPLKPSSDPFPPDLVPHHCFRARSPQTPPCAPDPSGQLDVLLHYGDPFGVDGAQVGVLEQMDHERFGGFLQRLYGLALPAQGVAADGDQGEADFAHLGLR